jgi:hypothetical protein
VTPVVRILALWLAALWLPLTMHCQLASLDDCHEAAAGCTNHCGCSDGGDCQSEVCKAIETGNYPVNKDLLLVPTASCESLGWLEPVAGQRLLTVAATPGESTGAPPGWGRIWQFVFRAALAPRAPAALC